MNQMPYSGTTFIGRMDSKSAKKAFPKEAGIKLFRGEDQHRVISGAQYPHRFPPTMHGRIV